MLNEFLMGSPRMQRANTRASSAHKKRLELFSVTSREVLPLDSFIASSSRINNVSAIPTTSSEFKPIYTGVKSTHEILKLIEPCSTRSRCEEVKDDLRDRFYPETVSRKNSRRSQKLTHHRFMDSQEQLKKDRILRDFRDSSSCFFDIADVTDDFEHQTNLHFNQGMNAQRLKLDE